MIQSNVDRTAALPILDLSVVTCNSLRWVAGFFESAIRQNYSVSRIRVFVWDDHWSEDTVAARHQFFQLHFRED
jgi:hypothetical protein